MRVLIFLCLASLLFAACSSGGTPGDIIPGERMGTIMWQLMEADEYINMVLAKDSTKKSSTERMKMYQQVFDLNNTSLPEFKKSYQFYMSHPDITKIIFDSIAAKTTRERTELYKPKPDTLQRRGTDSVMRKHDSLLKSRPDTAKRNAAINVKPGSNSLKPDTAKPAPKRVKRRLFKKPVKSTAAQ